MSGQQEQRDGTGPNLRYLSGFGNELTSEAVAGALPTEQNSPQRPPLGLYAEQLSGTAFTAPRARNRRSWLYRRRPSAAHPAFAALPAGAFGGEPFDAQDTPPNRLRWDPLDFPETETDFVDGLVTIAGNGSAASRAGSAVHLFTMNRGMSARVFASHDGELLLLPQAGAVVLVTEFGQLHVAPGEFALVPRGVRFAAAPADNRARGYICENFGALFELPELGPIGANGLAYARHFQVPVASPSANDAATEVVIKFMGRLWRTRLDHDPLDVVAWHGNLYPCKYDLARFNTINTVGYDHPDPSIFTVLTAPTPHAGVANVDLVVFPPRWLVAEHTFRPPWFHRNVMSEYMGLIRGRYDAKQDGFVPGGGSLHNCMTAHGPDRATYDRASAEPLEPRFLGDTLAFMFESSLVYRPTRFALTSPTLQKDYDACWAGFARGG